VKPGEKNPPPKKKKFTRDWRVIRRSYSGPYTKVAPANKTVPYGPYWGVDMVENPTFVKGEGNCMSLRVMVVKGWGMEFGKRTKRI